MADDINKWLAGDTTYQQQLANFQKSLADYLTQYSRNKQITERDFGETQRSMERQGQQDRMDQQNNFAGRGILRSGVFAKSLGDYNTDFNTKMKNLQTGQQDKVSDLDTQKLNFERQVGLEQDASKQDAIRRRAQKLGI